MPDRIIIWVLILHKVIGIFVDSIISQVHAHVLDVVLIYLFIGLCGQSGQTISIEEYPEGVHTKNEHIYPKIELQTLDEKGLIKVLLHHAMFTELNVLRWVHGQEDATTLARCFRFNNENWPLSPFCDLLIQLVCVLSELVTFTR